jgi:hypothetical protein
LQKIASVAIAIRESRAQESGVGQKLRTKRLRLGICVDLVA